MDNRINGFNSTSFKARYLNVVEPEKFPKKVYEAIYKSDAIEEFLKQGQPKTLLEKFIDLFRKNEILDVYYESFKTSKYDTFESTDTIHFTLRRGKNRSRVLSSPPMHQQGVRRPMGSIPKPGENPYFKEPLEYAADKIVKWLDKIKDFDKSLK